ncbi:hypothetical protein M2311_003712 [Rhizobium leguminosarum]|uniref:GcrA family cell cycle regulator n=1 Tax=Rhizobium leguminosarum TaxID=384 RepID=UPI001441062E|nr:GcrA family cell cycle regulator [Rhizobium leguminosarum]MDH6273622.1 hypothetical protein [Rhizobium leguminosarum]NKK01028.1 hypothetical protein [Rhizobium leguminosarum bv. viciae]
MSGYPAWSELSREQRLEAIRPMAASGLSANMIAKRFTGVSRNAIIGLCVRNKIALGKGQTNPASVSAARNRAAKRAQAPKVDRVQKPAPDMVDLGPIAKSRAFDPLDGVAPVSLENLGAKSCHWPVNGFKGHEPIFCGVSTANLYCTSHSRLAYTPHGH